MYSGYISVFIACLFYLHATVSIMHLCWDINSIVVSNELTDGIAIFVPICDSCDHITQQALFWQHIRSIVFVLKSNKFLFILAQTERLEKHFSKSLNICILDSKYITIIQTKETETNFHMLVQNVEMMLYFGHNRRMSTTEHVIF